MSNIRRRIGQLERKTGGGQRLEFICYKRDDGYFKDGRLYSEAEIEKIGETHEVIAIEFVVKWRDVGDASSGDSNTITVHWLDND